MDEDIDMSFIIPIDTVVDKGDDDIVLQILGERQNPEQDIRHAKSPQHKALAPDVVALTEEDIMGILDKETIADEVSADVFTNLLSDTISTSDSSNLNFQEILPQSLPEVIIQETPSPAKTHQKKTTTLHNQPLHESATSQSSPHGLTVPAVPADDSQNTPLTINLPPDLPAGRYIMRHSVTDPSIVELSFPDNPELSVLTLPVIPRAGPPSQPKPSVNGQKKRTVTPLSSTLGLRKSKAPPVTISYPKSNLPSVSSVNVTSVPNQFNVIPTSFTQAVPPGSQSRVVTPGGSQMGASVPISSVPFTALQTPVGVGSDYLPPGVPVRITEHISPNTHQVPSVSTVGGAPSAPVQIRYMDATRGLMVGQKIKVNQSQAQGPKLGTQVQMIQTGQGPVQRTVIDASSFVKKNLAYQTRTKNVTYVRAPPSIPQHTKSTSGLVGISPQQIQQMIPTHTANMASTGEQRTIPMLLSHPTGPPVNVLGKAFINQKGELVLTEAAGLPINKNLQPHTPAVRKMQKSQSLAPLSGLLNFAQLSMNKTGVPAVSSSPTEVNKERKQPQVLPRALKRKSSHSRTVTTSPCSNIEGQVFCPKVIVDDGLYDMVTEEVADEIPPDLFNYNTMRLREQSHKMTSVTIRESCISFRNEAAAVIDLQAKHRMMKEASDRSSHTEIKQEKDSLITGEVGSKTQKDQVHPVAEETKMIVLDPVENDQQNIQTTKDGKAPQSSLEETSPVETIEILSDDNAAELGDNLSKTLNQAGCRQSELNTIEETDVEYERLVNLYKKVTEEQNKNDQERKTKLDRLIGSGSNAQLLKKLFGSVPHFVDDPLTGDGNTPMYFCCYLCPFASFNEAKVCVHWTIAHLQSKPYMCGYCSARFMSSGKAHRHMALAHKNRKVLIKMVPSEMFTNSLQFEFVQETKDSNVLCPVIEVVQKEDLNPKLRRFACKECPFTSMKENEMMDHAKEEHFTLLPYTCGHCDKEFSYSGSVTSHIEAEHSGQEKSVRVDSRLVKLQEKLKLNDFYSVIPVNRPVIFEPAYAYWLSEESPQDKSKKQYACSLCTLVTKRLSVIWKHVREVHELPEGVYCKRCASYHRLTHVERANEFFICYSCCTLTSLKLTQKPHFIRLKQVFLCLKCSAQMEDLIAMKRHIKQNHIEVYPYSCAVCKAKFVIKQEAQSHCMLEHGSESVLEKHLSLVSKVIKRVRKLYIKYMFVEPGEEDGDLSSLWTEHGLAIVREGEQRLTRIEVETTTRSGRAEDGEANVEEGPEVDSTVFNVTKGSDRPSTAKAGEDDFKGLSHYRCRLCQYKCLDRSCMSRHVKYMHLRIHPHSCPFCGYSNVEKTKVKIHIMNLHNKSSKKVRTNTTLVTALGEESKKHFVRVYTDGREISQVEPAPRSGRATAKRWVPPDSEDSADDPGLDNIKLEPLEDDADIRRLDRDLRALTQQPVPRLFIRNRTTAGTSQGFLPEGVEIKEEPMDMEDLDERFAAESIGQVIHVQGTAEDMEVDTGSGDSNAPFSRSRSGPRSRRANREDSLLYHMLAPQQAQAQKRRAEAIARQAKRRKKDHTIYPDPYVIRDRKLMMLPVVILEDVIANYLSTF